MVLRMGRAARKRRTVVAAASVVDIAEVARDRRSRRLEGSELVLLGAVSVAAAEVRSSEAGLARRVVAARSAGLSWELIGSSLGISRQAAQQRFRG